MRVVLIRGLCVWTYYIVFRFDVIKVFSIILNDIFVIVLQLNHLQKDIALYHRAFSCKKFYTLLLRGIISICMLHSWSILLFWTHMSIFFTNKKVPIKSYIIHVGHNNKSKHIYYPTYHIFTVTLNVRITIINTTYSMSSPEFIRYCGTQLTMIEWSRTNILGTPLMPFCLPVDCRRGILWPLK